MFASCPNFRDLGGGSAADGREVRRGRVFRAGSLAHLGPEDHAALMSLAIRAIGDLRDADERAREPTRWPDPGVEMLQWDYRSPFGRVGAGLTRDDATPEDAEKVMRDFYGELPMALAPAIRDIFALVASGGTPLLFHCAAGKDRTGIVAALIQDILGVPRPVILADYARSAETMDFEAILNADSKATLGLDRDGAPVTRLPKHIRARLIASDPAYLQATFARLETESGSVAAYLTDSIGVAPENISGVRAALLA